MSVKESCKQCPVLPLQTCLNKVNNLAMDTTVFQVDKPQYCWLEILSLFVFHHCLGVGFFEMVSVLKLE